MTAEQRQLLDRLFDEVLALPPEDRDGFLDKNCPDFGVRSELELLISFATTSKLAGMVDAISETAANAAEAAMLGQRVGAYRLTGRIGQGGMGMVYRAVRDDDQFQQTVAIKLLRFAQSDPSGFKRFRRERQILATLEHIHIARLLDGGEWVPPGSGESQPYLVMEFVKGLPLIAYCQQQSLDIRQRLQLFRQVCDALSYAHQRLIVHRDIKPANILVTAEGTPKLLDFGVAKLLEVDAGPAAGTMTCTGRAMMTPDYASPEQVRGESVSTLTDVYSLGAVLYELLTDRRPHQLASYDAVEIAREICEREVPAPSRMISRQLHSDLDVIVLKALQNDAGRRYNSVEQLSEDIRRYMEGLPIIARPVTLAYRSAKFIGRHRFGVAAVAALTLALAGGLVVSTWAAVQASRARRMALLEKDRATAAERVATRERDRARAAEQGATSERNRAMAEKERADNESATANAINEFLQNDLLSQASIKTQAEPGAKPDPDLKVRTALDRAAARIVGKFGGLPLVEASVQQTMGKAYEDLGLYPEAERHFGRALELSRHTLGAQHPTTLNTMSSLGALSRREGKYAQAEQQLTRTVEVQWHVLGEMHPDTLATMDELDTTYRLEGKYAQAEPLYARVLAGRRRRLGAEHPRTLDTMNNLADLYTVEGKYGPAERLFTAALEGHRRVLGGDHPDTLGTMNNLAVLYNYEGKYGPAEDLYSDVIAIERRLLGEEHPRTLTTMHNLGSLYVLEGKYGPAERLLTTVLEGDRRVLGEEHPDSLLTMNALGNLHVIQGKYELAGEFLMKVLEGQRRLLGEDAPDVLSTMETLGYADFKQGLYERAAELETRVLEARRRVLGEEHPATLHVLIFLGEVRIMQQKYPEAETLLRKALGYFEKRSPDEWRRYHDEAMLGLSLAGQKQFTDAEPLLIAAYEELLRREATIPVNRRSILEQTGQWIVRLYQDWGKPEKAAEWREKVQAIKVTDSASKK